VFSGYLVEACFIIFPLAILTRELDQIHCHGCADRGLEVSLPFKLETDPDYIQVNGPPRIDILQGQRGPRLLQVISIFQRRKAYVENFSSCVSPFIESPEFHEMEDGILEKYWGCLEFD
jgi:hypothetical protein